MKATWLLMWIGVACAQQSPAPPGDVFNVNTSGQAAETPLRAFANLYQVAAEMTAAPGTDYAPGPGDQSDFPYPTSIQKQWTRSVGANGRQLTTEERQQLVPCAAHLNTAIDSMERGYRIEITQKGNAAAQQSAQSLYARARAEFALCAGANEFAKSQLGKSQPGTSDPGGKPAAPARPPLQGGVRTDVPGGPSTSPPPGGGSAPPPAGKEPDPIQYTKGIFRGLTDCAEYGVSALSAAAYMVSGDFVTAAKLLGLEPGQSVVLRSIYQEATTNNIGISPFEAGRIAGRRLCSYAIAPGSGRIFKGIKGLGAAGGTRLNALKGAAVVENAGGLAGKWVQTPKGPMKFGELIGEGKMGSVYQLPSQPGKVIKVSNATPESPVSFPRQLKGYNELLQHPQILTPKIYDPMFGKDGDPSFLVMDNINTKWPGARIFQDVKDVIGNPQRKAAAQAVYDDLKNAGLVWPDGHQLNLAFANVAGTVRAIIVDSDMIFKGSELGLQDTMTQYRLVGAVRAAGGPEIPLFAKSVEAGPIMDALFRYWYAE